jgi:hypothetical protein
VNNLIGEEGGIALGKALRHNYTVQLLYLSKDNSNMIDKMETTSEKKEEKK